MLDLKANAKFVYDEDEHIYRCELNEREFLFSRTPYDSQLALVNSIRDTIEAGGVGIYESPTGTGKTLSVITAVYSWLMDVFNSKVAVAESTGKRGEKKPRLPAFVESWGKKNSRLRLEEAVSRQRKGRHTSNVGKNTLVNCDDEASPSKGLDLRYTVPKVIFLSRTHSQLSQFVEEVKKTPYRSHFRHAEGSIFLLSLAGRKHTCLNKSVKEESGGSNEKFNELCIELGSACPYRNYDRIRTFARSIASPPSGKESESARTFTLSDIEELGELNTCCPYYTTREALPAAEIILAPYSMILDEGVKAESGIELEGSVVIFDEAHNLISACHDSLSELITVDSIRILKEGISILEDSLRAHSLVHTKLQYHSLHSVCTRIENCFGEKQFISSGDDGRCSFVREKNESNIHAKRIFTVNQFLLHCDISSYNFFSLSDFIQTCTVKKRKDPIGGFKKYLGALRRFLLRLSSDENDSIVVFEPADRTLKIVGLCARRVFHPILSRALAVIMVSGTIQPQEVLEAELFKANCINEQCENQVKEISRAVFPHVIQDSQVYVSCWAESFSGTRFRFSHSKIKDDEQLVFKETMIFGLSQVLLNLSGMVKGGVVVFFTSHEYLQRVVRMFKENDIFDAILLRGKKIFFEEKTKTVDDVLESYRSEIKSGNGKGAILMAVMGGKLSEGINFADDYGRVACVVGLPYPNPFDVENKARMKYLQEGRIETEIACPMSTQRNSSTKGYEDAVCMTIVSQTIGRVIRHKHDHAAILFLDERLLSQSLQSKLPAWVHRNFKTKIVKNRPTQITVLDEFFELRRFFESQ